MQYPIVLELSGRDVLVVGAGEVGLRKIRGLLTAGAKVRCVAPYGCEGVQQLADAFEIDWEKRRFRRGDVAGVFLVFATTDDPRVNRFVVSTSRKRAIPANCATDNDCDFFVPAVARRGPIGVATWTGVPALTRRLRDVVESMLDDRWERAASMLGAVRERWKTERAPDERQGLLRKAAEAAPDAFGSDDEGRAFLEDLENT
jgi:siroheme synthase-like protein